MEELFWRNIGKEDFLEFVSTGSRGKLEPLIMLGNIISFVQISFPGIRRPLKGYRRNFSSIPPFFFCLSGSGHLRRASLLITSRNLCLRKSARGYYLYFLENFHFVEIDNFFLSPFVKSFDRRLSLDYSNACYS